MKKTVIMITALGLLSACVSPPESPEERIARQAAQAEVVTSDCTIYVGGVAGIREIQQYAKMKQEQARRAGADEALLNKARVDARSAFSWMTSISGLPDACSIWLNDVVKQIG